METVFIQIPAALYVAIYDRHGEQATSVIASCLSASLSGDSPSAIQVQPEPVRYSRPRSGTITGKVWEIADRIKQQMGSADRRAVVTACINEGVNINTANTQFQYWKKANPE